MFEFESKQIETAEGDRYLSLIISGELMISDTPRLKEVLLAAFAEQQHVVLEMSGVTDLGFSAMQLFCATNKYAQKNGKRFELKNQCTGVFIDRGRSLGFFRDQACNEAEDPLRCLWIPENLT